MFEELKARILKGPLESQRLLMPAVVEVSPEQMNRLDDLAELFGRIGIEAEALGEKSIGIHAFASFLFEKGVDPVEFVGELIDKAGQQDLKSIDDEAALHELLDMMSCKAAIKAGDKLEPGEIHALLAKQREIERASRCPHGRPTTIRLTLGELEKQFGRR
jgi:DNA mismatch repair protein MutL